MRELRQAFEAVWRDLAKRGYIEDDQHMLEAAWWQFVQLSPPRHCIKREATPREYTLCTSASLGSAKLEWLANAHRCLQSSRTVTFE